MKFRHKMNDKFICAAGRQRCYRRAKLTLLCRSMSVCNSPLVNIAHAGMLATMWKTATLMTLMMMTAKQTFAQIPCPIALTTGTANHDKIKLSFRNKGKVPIEQFSLSCSPAPDHKSRGAVCHTESGIFYPGMEYWMDFPHPVSDRKEIIISVKSALVAGGIFWTPRYSDSYRTLRITGKK
jgi:hypothetical protein